MTTSHDTCRKKRSFRRMLPCLAVLLLLAAPMQLNAAEAVPARPVSASEQTGQADRAGHTGALYAEYAPPYGSEGGLYQEGIYLGELLNRSPVLQIAYCAETRGELLPCGT